MDTRSHQFVATEVTKKKFRRELAEFESQQEIFREKGVICLEQSGLSISFLFGVPHLKPMAIAFGVKFDYSNWDIEPPSIKFIDPFSGKAVSKEDIPIAFFQAKDPRNPVVQNGVIRELNLLQANDNFPPFFCIPGVKEYHDHFAHSGDLWLTHRNKGEGKLVTLLEQLWKHSVAQAGEYNIMIKQLQQLQVKHNVLDFQIVVDSVGIRTDLTKLN